MKNIRMLNRRQWLLILGLVLSLALTAFFAVRTFRRAPRPQVDEPIRPWMSVLYIAHSYHVPPQVLFQALGLRTEPPPDKRPISEIASEQNRSVDDLIAVLQKAIDQARPPTPPPPPSRLTTPGAP